MFFGFSNQPNRKGPPVVKKKMKPMSFGMGFSSNFGNPGKTKRKKNSINKGDWDRDGVTNMFDCRPFNHKKQDFIYGWQKPVNGKIIPAEKGESIKYGGRGSGHSGTGLYGYSTPQRAMKDKHVYGAERDLYSIEIKKPFKPNSAKAQKKYTEGWNNADFHDTLKDVKNQELTDENKAWIVERLDAYGIETTPEKIQRARDISDEKEINPANIILGDEGYDGIIYPEDDEIMDTHWGGSVKFEEEDVDENSPKIVKINQPGEVDDNK